MIREERNTKLKHFITCLKCEVSGKECNDNCPVQYEAGNTGEIIENLEAISKVLEQEHCEDTISREATLKPYNGLNDEDMISVWLIRKNIEQQSLVNPQPKQGHWIRVDKDKLRCSECDIIHFIGQYPQGKIAWCPNCGAKMIEPQESEGVKE